MLQVFDNKTIWKKVRRFHTLGCIQPTHKPALPARFDAPHPSEAGGRGQAKNSFVAHKICNVFENFQHPVVRPERSCGIAQLNRRCENG